MRSLLFVPGDSARKLDKAMQSGADALILDLEDSVAPSGKAAARQVTAEFMAATAGEPKRLLVVPGGHHRSVQHDLELQAVSLRFIEQAAGGGRGRTER